MKASSDFILREIAGEYILIPVGAAAAKFNGLITINETGHVIFCALSKECTITDLVDAITDEFDIDRETAQADVEEFLRQLRQAGALVE